MSVFLLAIGAILTFAIDASLSGVDLDTVGVILMIAGVIGLLTSMLFWNSWGGFGGRREERVVYHDREAT